MAKFRDDLTYISPVSLEIQAAVGRLVMAWAAVENALPRQVARLVAFGWADGSLTFDPSSYLKATTVCSGTNAKAALIQIVHLTKLTAFSGDADAARKAISTAASRLSDVKFRRDEVCHWLSSAHKEGLRLQYHSASRTKISGEKVYHVAQIDGWCDTMLRNARWIDETISDATGWTNARTDEAIAEATTDRHFVV